MSEKSAESQGITRRNLIVGAASLGAVAYAGKLHDDYNKKQSLSGSGISPTEQVVKSPESKEPNPELSNGEYFEYEIKKYSPLYEADAEVALSHAEVVGKIQELFVLPDIPSEIVRNNLEALMPGLAFAESRLDIKAKAGSTKAFGVMQLMPQAWKELAKKGEDIDSLEDQIKVAARLVTQAYKHLMNTCSKEFDQIRDGLFAGSQTEFESYFLTPVLVNSYNAGMGSLEKLVKQFAVACPNLEATEGLFDQTALLTKHDVFLGMAVTARLQEWVPWYKDDSLEYTAKVYSAHSVLRETYKKASVI